MNSEDFDLVVAAGAALTMNPGGEVLENALVCVRGGVIEKVEARVAGSPPPRAREAIDAPRGVVMPGFVNAHTHAPMTLFRGLADDLPLAEWLSGHIFPAEARHLSPGTARAGALLAAAEMLLAGVTSCCDGYFFEDAVAEALEDAGMRAVAGHGVIDFPAPGAPESAKNVDVAVGYAEKRLARGGIVRPSIFCHSPYTCSAETLVRAKAQASRLGVLFQVHAAETRAEREESLARHGKSPVAYLGGLGILDPSTLVVHGVWTDAADHAILADSGAAVAVAAGSNMKLGSGAPPLPRLLAAGVPVGLGTDGAASNNGLDLFREMRLVSRLFAPEPGEIPPLSGLQVLRLATSDAARAVGLGNETGTLSPGKRADFVVLDPFPGLALFPDPFSAIIHEAGAALVRHVAVDGRVLVRDGRLTALDLPAILADAGKIGRRISG